MRIGHSGWGWSRTGWVNNVHVNLNKYIRHATLCIFSCTCTHTSCYAMLSSLALAHIRQATLCYMLLQLPTYVMLRYAFFSCSCPHTSCYAMLSSFAAAHIRHATLCFLLLQLPTYIMLRYAICSCSCTRMSCYAMLSSLALAHIQ